MFLSYLKEVNKEGFLKICVNAAVSNEIFADEEKLAIAAYCREMDLDVHQPEISESFENLVRELSASTTKEEKNIIVLETLALVKSDGIYDEKEKEFMKKLIDGFGISDLELDKFDVLLDNYTQIGRELYTAITE